MFKTKGKTLLIIGFSLVILFVLYSLVSSSNRKPKAGSSTGNSSKSNNQSSQIKEWHFQKKTSKGSTTLFILPDVYNNQITQWNDYIFYGSGAYTTNVQVFSYNLKTGEIKTIYNQKDRNDLGNGKNNRYVTEMGIHDNNLTFSIGGYITSGASFYLPLPPRESAIKVSDVSGMTFMSNGFWLINSSQNMCHGSNTYSLFNPATRKMVPLTTLKTGCYDYVGVDKNNNILLAFRNPAAWEEALIYEYIVSFSIKNLTESNLLISKQNMPISVSFVKYNEDKNQIYLSDNKDYSGSKNYAFDLGSRLFVEVDRISEDEARPGYPTDKNFEDKIKELKLPADYGFILK